MEGGPALRVIYLGPAVSLTVGDVVARPGDSVDLSEAQLRALAMPPAGNGMHRFELAPEPEEPPKRRKTDPTSD